MTVATMEPSANPGTGEIAGIITAAVGALYAFGKGIVWLFGWRDRRQQQIEKAVEKYVANLERRVANAEDRTRAVEVENRRLHQALGQVALAFRLIASEVQRSDPKSTILAEARKIFEMAYPIPREAPEVIADLVDEIHERTKQ